MANPSRLTITLVAAVSNGICTSQTPGAAGNLTLNGSLVVAGPTYLGLNTYPLINGVTPAGTAAGNFTNYAQMDVARRISIASAGSSDGAAIFTVYGFNRDMQPIYQAVTGVVSGTPGVTTLDFLYVTQITVSAATAAAVTVGTNTVGSTAWIPPQLAVTAWALSGAALLISGSGTYQIEHTYDDPNAAINPPIGGYGFIVEANSATPPFAIVTGAVQSAPVVGTAYEVQYANQPIVAHRLTVLTGTGLFAFWSVQSGLRS